MILSVRRRRLLVAASPIRAQSPDKGQPAPGTTIQGNGMSFAGEIWCMYSTIKKVVPSF